jgi:type IV pilus assembly protein PilX
MLLILTLLAVSVMESSLVEERMAGNNLDRNIAFQVAEAALRAGEARVASFGNRPQPINGVASGSVSGLDAIPPASPNWWAGKDDAWWTTNGTEYDQDFAGTNEHPRYIIEEYDEVCDGAVDPTIRQCKIVYRVTAIAWGGRNTTVLLQSLFARRY